MRLQLRRDFQSMHAIFWSFWQTHAVVPKASDSTDGRYRKIYRQGESALVVHHEIGRPGPRQSETNMADKKPEKKQECVQVVVRCRPFSTKEKKENRGNIIGMETASFQVRELCALG